MLSDQLRKQLDDAIEAAGKLGGVEKDTALLRRMVYADLDQLTASHDKIAAAAGGDWDCKILDIALECTCGDGKGSGSGGTGGTLRARRDDHGPLVAFGGESCVTWGGCKLCIRYDCELAE
jgi:hypothetical protein